MIRRKHDKAWFHEPVRIWVIVRAESLLGQWPSAVEAGRYDSCRLARSTFDIGIDIRSYYTIKIAFDFSRGISVSVVKGFEETLFRQSDVSLRKMPLRNCF